MREQINAWLDKNRSRCDALYNVSSATAIRLAEVLKTYRTDRDNPELAQAVLDAIQAFESARKWKYVTSYPVTTDDPNWLERTMVLHWMDIPYQFGIHVNDPDMLFRHWSPRRAPIYGRKSQDQ